VDNCKIRHAKKFESKPKGFCCRSGDIHLSTLDTPPELMRLWDSSDADASHFREHIKNFDGNLSFTSLYFNFTPPRHMVFTHSLHMMPFTMMLTTLVEREKQEPTLLELYFYNTDPSLNYKLGKCLIRPYKKIDRSFISWLTSSVPTLISTRIIYEIGGECFRLPYRVQP
jgi:hypothetical protein